MKKLTLIFITVLITYLCNNIYAQVNLDSNLVAYYPFNGNANDESGNNYDGTVFGATLTSDRFGNVNSAYEFDGIDDYINVGDPIDGGLDLGANDWSISAWAFETTDSTHPPGGLVVKHSSGNDKEYSLQINSFGELEEVTVGIERDGNDSAVYTDSSGIQHSLWYHLVATFEASSRNVNIYVNSNIAPVLGSILALPDTFSAELEIGRIAYLPSYFKGLIDDIRIYDRILIQAEIDSLFNEGTTSVEEIGSTIPDAFELYQNFPNPFNPSTNIEYSIPEESFVQLKVYDILGNEVATLVNEEQPAGSYRADFNGNKLSSGLYIAQLTAANYTQTIKMSLLK
jgi:hypothetical protein